MSISFLIPGYIDLIRKTDNRWSKPITTDIYNLSDKPYDESKKYSKFGLTQMEVLKELYLRYQGLDGWYLVHLAEKQYYYCGATASDVNDKLVE
jgi:hypothetical protein